MSLKRLDLPDGQWADLLERPLHEDYVAILEAAEDAARGGGTWVRWAETLGRRYCKAWSVRGDDGAPLDLKDWGRADPDITDAICTEAQNRYQAWEASRVPLVARLPRPARSSAPATPSADTSGDNPSS